MTKMDNDDLKGNLAFSGRNSYTSISEEPITEKQIKQLRGKLTRLWEDTQIVTFPNGYRIITVGNLIALCDTMLTGKGLVKESDGERHVQDKLIP